MPLPTKSKPFHLRSTVASLRSLKTKWQIRYFDSRRQPKEIQDSLPKEGPDAYTEAEVRSEKEYRQ
jgi:hypothetical protein